MQYTNFRVFLRDWYEYRKANSAAFSLRYFAEKAGLSSHAHLKLVIDGKRNITKKTVTCLLLGMGMQGKRAEYFENLVFFNQVDTEKEKRHYYEKLLRISPRSRLRTLEDAQFRIFREWYHCVVRELTVLGDFRSQGQWISKKLGGKVSPLQVEESLRLLTELGLLVRTANGHRQADALLTTDDEVQGMLVRDYHKQMIAQAVLALDELSGEQRDISALTFAIRRKDFAVLKKHIQLMRKELLDFQVGAGEAEEIVQVNIQLFPLTRN